LIDNPVHVFSVMLYGSSPPIYDNLKPLLYVAAIFSSRPLYSQVSINATPVMVRLGQYSIHIC